MALMHMVEMTSHEVVRMVAVGNSLMAAARAVPVGGFVTAARVSSTAFRRIIGIRTDQVGTEGRPARDYVDLMKHKCV